VLKFSSFAELGEVFLIAPLLVPVEQIGLHMVKTPSAVKEITD
jgi:hypothetical protein